MPFSQRVIPSQPTLIPLASVITGCHAVRRVVARPANSKPDLSQVLARLRESRPPLVHHVVIGKRDNLDPAGLQRLGQRHRRVKHKRLRPMRVLRRHRRLHVHKPEIGALENVAHIAEQRRPSASPSPAAAAAALTGSCGITSPPTAKLTCASSCG